MWTGLSKRMVLYLLKHKNNKKDAATLSPFQTFRDIRNKENKILGTVSDIIK